MQVTLKQKCLNQTISKLQELITITTATAPEVMKQNMSLEGEESQAKHRSDRRGKSNYNKYGNGHHSARGAEMEDA